MRYHFEVSDERNRHAPKQEISSTGEFVQMMNDIYRTVKRMDTVGTSYRDAFIKWCEKFLAEVKKV